MININAIPKAIILLLQDDLESQLPVDLHDYCNKVQGMIKHGMNRKNVPMSVVLELVIHIVRENPYIEWFDKKPDGKYRIRWKRKVKKKKREKPVPATEPDPPVVKRHIIKDTRPVELQDLPDPKFCGIGFPCGDHYWIHLDDEQFEHLLEEGEEHGYSQQLGDHRYPDQIKSEFELRNRRIQSGDQTYYRNHGPLDGRDLFHQRGSYPKWPD